jgi:hypothetical protein
MIIAHWQLETTNNWIKMKHRILKDGNRYYPQFKLWLFWCDYYDDSLGAYHHHGISGDHLSLWCDTLEEALEYFDDKNIPVIEK